LDFTTIGAALGLVSTATGATSNAVALAEKIKNLVGSGDAKDSSEAVQLLGTLANELTSANIMNLELSKNLKALSQELQRHDEFEKEKARYELFETPQNDFVYRLRDELANGEPTHFICPVCLKRDKLVSFLVGRYSRQCQTDHRHSYSFDPMPPRQRVGPMVV
jgi:hypothetical protein